MVGDWFAFSLSNAGVRALVWCLACSNPYGFDRWQEEHLLGECPRDTAPVKVEIGLLMFNL